MVVRLLDVPDKRRLLEQQEIDQASQDGCGIVELGVHALTKEERERGCR
jgi:hypothetical protein